MTPAEVAQIKQLVREELFRVLGSALLPQTGEEFDLQLVDAPKSDRTWVNIREIERDLDLTARQLKLARENGTLIHGVHYRCSNFSSGGSGKGTRYQYHVENCRKVFYG